MGKSLDNDQIHAMQVMFEESGAIAFGKKGILEYSQKAKTVLDSLSLHAEAKESILGLIKKIEKME
jgi:geranylgeranyl pyrophosphate synthase